MMQRKSGEQNVHNGSVTMLLWGDYQVIKPLTQWTGNLLTLPVDIPPDTSYPFAKLAERISHPLELSRMRMAAHLPRQLGNHTAVALPQFQATRSGSLDQMLSVNDPQNH